MAPKTAQDSFKQPKIDPLLLKNRSKLAQTWTKGATKSPKKPQKWIAAVPAASAADAGDPANRDNGNNSNQ